MWSRCTCVAPRALWSGSIPRGPSLLTSDPTWSPQPPPASPSASNPLQTPEAPTFSWTVTASCGCCCVKRTKLWARCSASVSARGRSSSKPSRTWTSAAGSRRSSMSCSATGWDRTHTHWVVRWISISMLSLYNFRPEPVYVTITKVCRLLVDPSRTVFLCALSLWCVLCTKCSHLLVETLNKLDSNRSPFLWQHCL